MTATSLTVPLTCTSGDRCSWPHGYALRGGILTITSRHHGEKHVYSTSVPLLLELFIKHKLIPEEMLRSIVAIAEEALAA